MEQQKPLRTHDYFAQAPPTLIDIKELSRRLNMARGTLYNWVWQERLSPIRIGRNLRFDYDEVLLSFRHSHARLDRDTPQGGA
jgi:excisionase family DNA binding protein